MAISLAWTVGAGVSVLSVLADASPSHTHRSIDNTASRHTHLHLDRSGKRQVGEASFYASRYAGKKMADGTPMQLNGNNAASITLPLGTTAQVTNLASGRSAIITIRDRGPYVAGRIVDLSPGTARKIGLDQKTGIAMVEVRPLSLPLPDGTMKRTNSAS